MGKYSENPIDNLQGYLSNIEMILERMEAQQKKLAETSSNDNSEQEALNDIRKAINDIRKDNGLITASMNTVAEAIGTVPTEEERNRLHQKDLQYIIDNTKKNVTVDLDPATKAQLNNIDGKLSEPLNKLAANFEKRIGKVVEKKAKSAENSDMWRTIEIWFWRTVFFLCAIALFILWMWPKIEDIEFPGGAEGFLYSVLGFLIVSLILVGIYKWGKSNGNGYY